MSTRLLSSLLSALSNLFFLHFVSSLLRRRPLFARPSRVSNPPSLIPSPRHPRLVRFDSICKFVVHYCLRVYPPPPSPQTIIFFTTSFSPMHARVSIVDRGSLTEDNHSNIVGNASISRTVALAVRVATAMLRRRSSRHGGRWREWRSHDA